MLLLVDESQLVHVVLIDAEVKDEAGQGVKVSEYGEEPASLAAALDQLLDVRMIDEPGLVAEELFELV